jgi:hypothetical protein
MPVDTDRREEHVADDSSLGFRNGDKRDRRGARGVQQLNQPRFVFPAFERPQMHVADGPTILGAV